MAGDVVILLSDDSDSDGAFVTPHPVTASPANNRTSGFSTSQEATRLPPPQLNLPTPALAASATRRIVDIIEIDDTPVPPRPSHRPKAPPAPVPPGFWSIPGDGFIEPSSSAAVAAVSSPRPQVLNQTPSQPSVSTRLPPPLSAYRSPLQESIRERAAKAILERLQANQSLQVNNLSSPMPNNHVFDDDDGLDDNDNFGRDRPAKRMRLSSGVGSHDAASRPTQRQPPPPSVDAIDSPPRRSPPRRSLPVQPISSPVAPLNPQRLSRFAHTFNYFDDDIDDIEDDIGDFPAPALQTRPAPAPVRPAQARQPCPPKANAECIDLLSSSDSEHEQSRLSTRLPAIDSDFVDIDDLIANPSPRARKQQQPQSQLQRQSTTQWPTGHMREPSDEIVLLSSPSVVSTVVRQRSRPAVIASAAIPPRRERPLQRSVSEAHGHASHAFVFSDEEDDEYDAATADALLAEWRASRKAAESQSPTKPSVKKAPARTTARRPPAKRRSSFDEASATDRQKQKKLEAEEKRKEREAERERKQKEKEIDKERRKTAADMAKEKKAKEKAEAAAFNDANKSRVDKAVAAPEMIVRLPSTLPQATKEVAQAMLVEVKASHEEWTSRPVDNVVTWRRKTSNDYRPDLGHWVPVPTRIEDEKHALVVLRGNDFVQLVLARDGDPDIRHQTGGHDLDSHVAAMKRAFAGHTIVYLIEGLNAWKSKNKTIRNRQFVAAVRGGSDAGGGGASAASTSSSTTTTVRPSQRLGRRGQKQAPQHLDVTLVEDALFDLQIEHSGSSDGSGGGVLVHETASSLDTARWIKVFTEQIAIARYRQQREELYAAAASFCMDSGQIATGDDAADTFLLMLQQVGRVTEAIAMGVATRYYTLPKLIQGFADDGPLALETCLRSRNRNGALSDRTVGQALSRRLYKVFTGRDPESTDV
ncbi:hypothetical protein Sste5346_008398 [Sporothrix stenoceras]|uniref:ERCC4 domain-containing protein n=1 Tax=Sporothrix stenoceras TaxID=5173 RepID=A0ABR3YPG0_9PEZI